MKQTNTNITRPKTKPVTSTKGKLNEWENGYKEFIPQGTKESQRKMLKQLGDSSFYKTEGKKESSYSLHLNVDADTPDPVAAMHELFMELTKGERKQPDTLYWDKMDGRMLYDDGLHLQIWHNRKNRVVNIVASLWAEGGIERMLLELQADMLRTIGRYRNEIINSNK